MLVFSLFTGLCIYSNQTNSAIQTFIRNVKFPESESKSILAAVQDGTLVADATGVVVLPKRLDSITEDGRAYVTRKGNLLMVLLPTWRGKGANLRGYLLCSRPLSVADMHKDYYEGKYDAVNIITPDAGVPTQFEVILEEKLNNTTYDVSRNLD